jgi:hypothetical protein
MIGRGSLSTLLAGRGLKVESKPSSLENVETSPIFSRNLPRTAKDARWDSDRVCRRDYSSHLVVVVEDVDMSGYLQGLVKLGVTPCARHGVE